ncbi:hypothetical protein [Hymenobacter sp. HDW8]|uniref:hypothetical protein n=1 Tax=Hymenobacter sp. HDW8 TaxID=2714932 RepID=UPI001F10DC24|nr:hypothetical protein [Hymenobacter sp. HDW8]
MDVPIQKKTWTLRKLLLSGGIVVVLALLAASYFSTTGSSKLNVDPERITISEVTRGLFRSLFRLTAP